MTKTSDHCDDREMNKYRNEQCYLGSWKVLLKPLDRDWQHLIEYIDLEKIAEKMSI